METAESVLVPGYRLDRYELICPIAAGGMASVWLARLRGKRGFEKLFAVKTINTELISNPQFQEMFLDEARIASQIVHPNVAQILELGEQDDILYIVMEYVDGDSLAKISRLALKRGTPLPPGISLRIIAETCAGLHAAHQLKDATGASLGVVHRDVSPQNILLTTEGTAKVIDFGLVKAKNRGASETAHGIVKGKIRYMAPEQVGAPRQIDHRADVWAAGMCLYELLVGHMPFHEDDDLDVLKRLMGPEPRPPFDVALPPQIEGILSRALTKDPAGRYPSCAQLKRAIEGAIHELELAATNDDVASFVAEALPDLAAKRAATVAMAVEVAQARQTRPPVDGPEPGTPAGIETRAAGWDPTSDAELPLTRKRGSSDESDAERAVSSNYASRPSTAPSLLGQLDQRKRRGSSGLVVTAVVVCCTATWLLWPRSGRGPGAPNTAAAPSSVETSATGAPPPADSAIELDAVDAGAGARAPTSRGQRRRSPPRAPEETPPPAPTYNPAWSILTNPPPEAGLMNPARAPVPSAPAAPSPPAPDPE
ncbi:MAG TPA: serine/threonine-protein kinase [Labilithrix sp.]|nr:serine/threonine-protein kinase [Labilithrix sp.]